MKLYNFYVNGQLIAQHAPNLSNDKGYIFSVPYDACQRHGDRYHWPDATPKVSAVYVADSENENGL